MPNGFLFIFKRKSVENSVFWSVEWGIKGVMMGIYSTVRAPAQCGKVKWKHLLVCVE